MGSDEERADALRKWAQRVISATKAVEPAGGEQRSSPRHQLQRTMKMIPVDPNSSRPLYRHQLVGVTRDVSVSGMSIVVDRVLEHQHFFVQFEGMESIFLVLRIRERSIQGSIREYGFRIADRYASMEALQQAMS